MSLLRLANGSWVTHLSEAEVKMILPSSADRKGVKKKEKTTPNAYVQVLLGSLQHPSQELRRYLESQLGSLRSQGKCQLLESKMGVGGKGDLLGRVVETITPMACECRVVAAAFDMHICKSS